MRSLVTRVVALVASCCVAFAGERRQPWSERTVELVESVPIQDGGRVKPLSTFASFTLLRLSGRRWLTTPSDEKLSPTSWLLDVLFFPEDAEHYAVFLVQDSDVIRAVGLSIADKRKRDRYSFDELRPGLSKLMSLAHEYSSIEDRDRSSLERQVVNLAENVLAFVRLNGHETLAIVPPIEASTVEWSTPAELAARDAAGNALPEAHADVLARLAALAAQRNDPSGFERELAALHTRVVGLADARGEYAKIPLEIRYYKAGLLSTSLALFVCAFLAAAALWLRPRSPWLRRATWVTVLAATLSLGAAITLRCMIRSRPPVSTLYETVLFVTAVGASLALVLELLDKKRIAISAAAFLGTVGLFVANGYETLDKQDTMPSLVAVLDTNFWLATHVTAITIGYSAGLLAALLASVYLIGKALRLRRNDAAHYRSLARMVYGVLCFGMIFATVGTILGGIWANESWGRFWGWDPKENGALLIVVSQVAILHGRMCGWLRDHGLCMAAAFGGSVVAFSWWGVNLLGVGLHSYGFTSGIHSALWTYYGLQWAVVAAGGLALWRERVERRAVAHLSLAVSQARKAA